MKKSPIGIPWWFSYLHYIWLLESLQILDYLKNEEKQSFVETSFNFIWIKMVYDIELQYMTTLCVLLD